MASGKDKAMMDDGVIWDGAETIRGVFSSQVAIANGSPAAQRMALRKTYWISQELEDGTVEVQPLNRNYIPSGPKTVIDRDDFLTNYRPEPEFYMARVYPAMREAAARLEGKRERTAEPVDEESIRAGFGLGLTYLDRGDWNRASDIFERIADLRGSFKMEHKHMFNEFGINMRKNRLYDEALRFYRRAMELVDNDEYLFHNIARCHYEKGDVEECKRYLKMSLRLNPQFKEGQLFWEFLRKNGHVGERETPLTRY